MPSREEIRRDIRRVDGELPEGERVTTRKYNELGEFSASTVYEEYEDWEEAVEDATGRYEGPKTDVSKDEVKEDLKRVGDEVDGYVSVGEYERRGSYSRSHVYNYWEVWEEAIKEVLGVEKGPFFDEDDEYRT
jgi:hypothetical protein